MATLETITLVGGPLDGEALEGAFGQRVYLDTGLRQVPPPLTMDGPRNTYLSTHRYARSLPTHEFEYEGFQ